MERSLIDFGVAKADNRLDETVGHTIKGKFAYMSPEQIEGGKVDGRADLFAVALTLHELVDGRRPFAGLNEVQIMHRVLSGNIPSSWSRGPSATLSLFKRYMNVHWPQIQRIDIRQQVTCKKP